MSGPLLALDVPWLLYRSHFGLPSSIRGAGGERVGALLGTLNTILALVDWCDPRAVACCLGAEEAAYRVALYPPYHAHRCPPSFARSGIARRRCSKPSAGACARTRSSRPTT